jgi:hypothetical protein
MANYNVGGTLNFRVGAQSYALAGTFSYDLGGLKRQPAVGPSGVNGFTTAYYAPKIEAELQDGGAVSIATLQSITNSTLVLELGNGKIATFYGGFQQGEIPNTVNEAKIKVEFGAITATEVTAS